MDAKLQKIQETMENEMRQITVADVMTDIRKEIKDQEK